MNTSPSSPQDTPIKDIKHTDLTDVILNIIDEGDSNRYQVALRLTAHFNQLITRSKIDGAKEYNRVLTDTLWKPTYMDDDDGVRQTVYLHAQVSDAIQKANSETITNLKESLNE